MRQRFSMADLERDCRVESGCHQLDGRALGLRVQVPAGLFGRYPYNASAYAFLQELRPALRDAGLIEFPGLPLNPINHTLAQHAPWQHGYSSNPYLTDICQQPHQDTPPWPTAFWLGATRRYFATWVVSRRGLEAWLELQRQEPALDVTGLHRRLVPASLEQGIGLLINRDPGLILVDNSSARALYHARTCLFDAVAAAAPGSEDAPMHAFNEIGLLHYIDQLDSRRGPEHRDARDLAEVRAFIAAEGEPPP